MDVPSQSYISKEVVEIYNQVAQLYIDHSGNFDSLTVSSNPFLDVRQSIKENILTVYKQINPEDSSREDVITIDLATEGIGGVTEKFSSLDDIINQITIPDSKPRSSSGSGSVVGGVEGVEGFKGKGRRLRKTLRKGKKHTYKRRHNRK